LGLSQKFFACILLSTVLLEFNSFAVAHVLARKGSFMAKDDNDVAQPSGVLNAALDVVGDALARLRYGAINLVIHDGKVVQIDVTERKRLTD
jgi:hypothetical protein